MNALAKSSIAALSTFALGGCLPMMLYYDVKPGISAAQWEADTRECKELGSIGRRDAEAKVASQPGVSGAAAAGLAQGISGERGAFKTREECYAAKGYTRKLMSGPDREIFSNLDFDQKRRAAAFIATGGDLKDFQP